MHFSKSLLALLLACGLLASSCSSSGPHGPRDGRGHDDGHHGGWGGHRSPRH